MVNLEKDRIKKLAKLEKQIGFCFPDKFLLNQSLVHSSYAHLHGLSSNERLEFLGDSVLGFSVSEFLFHKDRSWDEGFLTRIRSQLVSRRVLSFVATKISLFSYVLVAGGLEFYPLEKKSGILGDALESLLGAMYLSFGYKLASEWILSHLQVFWDEQSLEKLMQQDYKSQLQILVQKKFNNPPSYEIVSVKGLEHNQIMTSRVFVDGWFSNEGVGKSKKDAEQNAAKIALKAISSARE